MKLVTPNTCAENLQMAERNEMASMEIQSPVD